MERWPVYALNLTIPPLTAGLLLMALSLGLIWSIMSRRRAAPVAAATPTSRPAPAELLSELPLLICAFDAQGLISFWNKECERLSGFSAAEVLASPQLGYQLFSEQPGAWPADFNELLLTDRAGQTHLVRWRRTLAPAGVWLCGYDATTIERLKHEVNRCHKVLADIFSELGRSLYVVDAQFKIVLSNVAAPENQTCYAELRASRQPCEPCPARAIFASGKSRHLKRELAGRVEEVDLIAIPGPDGAVEFVAEIIEDTTEKQLAERERRLLERHQRQDQKLEALATLAGGLAHDFNNILASICGYAELIEYEQPADSQARHCADEIMQAALRAKTLIGQVLMFSRQSPVKPRAVAVAPLVRETVAGCQAKLAPGVEFKLEIEAASACVWADPYQIHRLIQSLCENAAQATSRGCISVELSECVSALPEGDCLRLRITDNGQGMDEATLARIFEPFFTTREMGRGLGLAMAQSIVQSLGGEITVKSKPGQGSCFSVYLPTSASAPPVRRLAELPKGRGENILVIDAQTEVLDQAQTELSQLAYNVTALSDAAAACKLIESHPESFAAAIIGVGLQEDAGLRLARRSNALNDQLPLILASSYADSLDPFLLRSMAITQLVHKPLTAAELADSLASLLAGT